MFSSYVFYTDVFHGDLLTEEEFPKYADRADVWLEYYTRGRVSRPDLAPRVLNAVKKAECAVADALRASAPASPDRDPSVQKETVGDYSVSFRSASELDAETNGRISGIITRYLAHTGLLFRGIGVAPSCGSSRFPHV